MESSRRDPFTVKIIPILRCPIPVFGMKVKQGKSVTMLL